MIGATPRREAGMASAPRVVLLLALVAGLTACRAPTRHQPAEGALGPYSDAVIAGDVVFVSGKVGPADATFAEQAEGALAAVEASLVRSGLSLADVVSVTVYLTDMARYGEFNALYAERMPAPHPARACVAVAALPGGRLVEVQAIARRR